MKKLLRSPRHCEQGKFGNFWITLFLQHLILFDFILAATLLGTIMHSLSLWRQPEISKDPHPAAS